MSWLWQWGGWSWQGWVALGSIGTVGTLVFAFVQIEGERRQRRALEQADRLQRHLAQARLISAVMGPQVRPAREGEIGRTGVDLVNSSDQPVYGLVVGIVFIQGAGPETIEAMLEYSKQNEGRAIPVTTASVLPPRGTFRVWIAGVGWSSIMAGRAGGQGRLPLPAVRALS